MDLQVQEKNKLDLVRKQRWSGDIDKVSKLLEVKRFRSLIESQE